MVVSPNVTTAPLKRGRVALGAATARKNDPALVRGDSTGRWREARRATQWARGLGGERGDRGRRDERGESRRRLGGAGPGVRRLVMEIGMRRSVCEGRHRGRVRAVGDGGGTEIR